MSQKWSAAQHRKYSATCKAKRLAREQGNVLVKAPTSMSPKKGITLLTFAIDEYDKDKPDYEVVRAYIVLARAALEEQ